MKSIENENYVDINYLANAFNFSRKTMYVKIKKLINLGKIKYRKIKINESFSKLEVLEKDVCENISRNKKVEQSKKYDGSKKKTILNIINNLKSENIDVTGKNIKEELVKIGISASDPYVWNILKDWKAKNNIVEINSKKSEKNNVFFKMDSILNAFELEKNDNFTASYLQELKEKFHSVDNALEQINLSSEIYNEFKNSCDLNDEQAEWVHMCFVDSLKKIFTFLKG